MPRWIQIPGKGLVPAEEAYNPPITHHVCVDIQPYKSMVTGEIIDGRAQHREHLRRHNMIEIGNEKQTARPYEPPKGLKDRLIAVSHDKLRYR